MTEVQSDHFYLAISLRHFCQVQRIQLQEYPAACRKIKIILSLLLSQKSLDAYHLIELVVPTKMQAQKIHLQI